MTELAGIERRLRWARGITSGALVVLGASVLVGGELASATDDDRLTTRAVGGLGVVLGATLFVHALWVQSPVERLTTVWHRDPGLLHIEPTVGSTLGRATFGFAGTF
jgi:hypothetical protein